MSEDEGKILTWADYMAAMEKAQNEDRGIPPLIVSPQLLAALDEFFRREKLWHVRLRRWLSLPFQRLYYRHIYWRFIHKDTDWGDYPPT